MRMSDSTSASVSSNQKNIMESLTEYLQDSQKELDSLNETLQLLIFDENQKIKFSVGCTIMVNTAAKRLTIQPNDENKNTMCVCFNEKIVRRKKLLCFYASETNQSSFILLFSTKLECKEVFQTIQSKKQQLQEDPASNILEGERLRTNFLHPVIQFIKELQLKTLKVKNFADGILNSLSSEEREDYQNTFIDTQMDNIFKIKNGANVSIADGNQENLQNDDDRENINPNQNDGGGVQRKSKADKRSLAEVQRENVEPSPKRNNPGTPMFYDHSPHPHHPTPRSRSIGGGTPQQQRRRSNDGNGQEKIVKRPLFELKYELRRKEGQEETLYVYLDNDKTLYHLYYFSQKIDMYKCPKCARHVTAKLITSHNNNDDDYVLMSKIPHGCKPFLTSITAFTNDDRDSSNTPSTSRPPIGG